MLISCGWLSLSPAPVMRMNFAFSCKSEIGPAAAISHTRTNAAEHLENGLRKGTLKRNTTLNPLGNELTASVLEISVLAAFVHRGYRTHSAIDLERTALIDLHVSRGFGTSGKERADHNG